MRLAIAATVLAQTISTWSNSMKGSTQVESVQVPRTMDSKRALLDMLGMSGRRFFQDFHQEDRSPHRRIRRLSSSANIFKWRHRRECDPDVGLLACGAGLYCKASVESSLGGFCRPVSPPLRDGNRNLEDYYGYEGNYTTYDIGNYYCVTAADYYDCDCSHWDTDLKQGYLTCQFYDDMCMPLCSDICYDETGYYTRDENGVWLYTDCYHFFAPVEQNTCISVSSDQNCSISLDGEECDMCNATADCIYFDCRNLGLNSGSLCEDPIGLPILEDCISGTYEPCDLCPGGTLNPEGEVEFLGFYGQASCSYLDDMALNGYVSESSCPTLSAMIEEGCCLSNGDTATTISVVESFGVPVAAAGALVVAFL